MQGHSVSLVGNVCVALANIIKGTIFGAVSVDFPTSDRNIILQTDIQLPNLLLSALVVYRLKPMLASAESQSLCEGTWPMLYLYVAYSTLLQMPYFRHCWYKHRTHRNLITTHSHIPRPIHHFSTPIVQLRTFQISILSSRMDLI